MNPSDTGPPSVEPEWLTDPWDDPAALPATSFETEPARFEGWRKPLQRVVAVLTAVTVLTGILGLWVLRQINPPGPPGAPVTFVVTEGDGLTEVIDRLSDLGVISNRWIFSWYARTTGGIDLVPGYFSVRPGDTAGRIIEALETPPSETFNEVTLPEGFTVAQMAGRIVEKNPGLSVDTFMSSTLEEGTLAPTGTTSLEGLLFPDTYQIAGDDTEQKVVNRLARTMERVAREEGLDRARSTVGYSAYEVLVVASMIEREAKVDEDRPKIAAVIYNRLARTGKEKMRLEIDATLLYGAAEGASVSELKAIDGPYNTYTRDGLPPTPISNPGRASIRAAMHPAPVPASGDEACAGLPRGTKCEYLFYVVADEKGRHAFATTLAQHLANVERARAAGLLG